LELGAVFSTPCRRPLVSTSATVGSFPGLRAWRLFPATNCGAAQKLNVFRGSANKRRSPFSDQLTRGDLLPNAAESGFLGSRFFVRVLCILMLLYIPVQWVFGRHPGGASSTFSHRDEERQFLGMISALRQQTVSQCTQHGVHNIFFSLDDVMAAYVVNQVEATPGCEIARETPVTMNVTARELACSAEVVFERRPDAWHPGPYVPALGPLQGKVAPVSTWESDGGQFGFTLLQAKGCSNANTAAGETR